MAASRLGPLRSRLTVGIVLLAGIGLLIADTAPVVTLWFYFRHNADSGLYQAERIVRAAPGPYVLSSVQQLEPEAFYVAFLGEDGQVIAESGGAQANATDRPALPAVIGPGYAARPVAAAAVGNRTHRYRVLAFAAPPGRAVEAVKGAPPIPVARIVVARSLRFDDGVLSWLLGVEVVATLVVLIGIAVLSRTVLRVGLRPLRDMTATASAIEAGELGRRVPVAERRDEAREVGLALNRAFDARERADARLRQFISDASHELRTPLATIRGWAQNYEHGLAQDRESVDHAIARIDAEAARMHRLVAAMLQLARLDQVSAASEEPVNLGALAREAAGDVRAVDPGRVVEVSAAEHVYVSGDIDQLRQVLQNLLSNALRHTPSEATISVTVAVSETGEVELTVADSGPGLDDSSIERVFERFYRGGGSGGDGTGLGLSIVKEIVERHGGTITVRSEGGAIFTATFPRCR
ncbi:two-component system OmpR family sensor kinase [Nocardia sp. GAS34]|uniref:sensor histidine kinase n=1 Tax=unclassified Nocardia TaxID=2637762 RepID=UPI003D226D3B